MDIKFILKQDETMNYMSFWTGREKYSFEITYNTEDEFEKYSKELFLNLKNQFRNLDFKKITKEVQFIHKKGSLRSPTLNLN